MGNKDNKTMHSLSFRLFSNRLNNFVYWFQFKVSGVSEDETRQFNQCSLRHCYLCQLKNASYRSPSPQFWCQEQSPMARMYRNGPGKGWCRKDNLENATVTRKTDIDSYSPLKIIKRLLSKIYSKCLPHHKQCSTTPSCSSMFLSNRIASLGSV